MTDIHVPGKQHRMGRKKEWTEQLRLPLAEGTIAKIDSVLADDEPRVDFIRSAVDREIRRRLKTATGMKSPSSE